MDEHPIYYYVHLNINCLSGPLLLPSIIHFKLLVFNLSKPQIFSIIITIGLRTVMSIYHQSADIINHSRLICLFFDNRLSKKKDH